MRNVFLMAMVAASLLVVLSGCATVEGLGKDMKKAGTWVEEKAK